MRRQRSPASKASRSSKATSSRASLCGEPVEIELAIGCGLAPAQAAQVRRVDPAREAVDALALAGHQEHLLLHAEEREGLRGESAVGKLRQAGRGDPAVRVEAPAPHPAAGHRRAKHVKV